MCYTCYMKRRKVQKCYRLPQKTIDQIKYMAMVEWKSESEVVEDCIMVYHEHQSKTKDSKDVVRELQCVIDELSYREAKRIEEAVSIEEPKYVRDEYSQE